VKPVAAASLWALARNRSSTRNVIRGCSFRCSLPLRLLRGGFFAVGFSLMQRHRDGAKRGSIQQRGCPSLARLVFV
jgi:hypothetical protein